MASTIKLKNGSGAPLASDLVQGEPAFDLTNKRLYTEDASGTVIEVGTNPSSLTTSSADINGGTIDGTVIGGSSAAAGTFTSITGTSANINGTVTADGLTVDGDSYITGNDQYNTGTTYYYTNRETRYYNTANNNWATIKNPSTTGGDIRITTGGGGGALFESSGDISFYEDTGTTAKFFWDASAESLGIGTSSPNKELEVASSDYTVAMRLQSNTSDPNYYTDFTHAGSSGLTIATTIFGQPTTSMTLKNGNVGIGTTPDASSKLDVLLGASSRLLFRERSSRGYIDSVNETNAAFDSLGINGSEILFETGAAEAMRIDSSGRVGIGTSSPSNPLQVKTGTDENLAVQTKSGAVGITAYNDAVSSNINLHLQGTQLIFDGAGATERMRIDSSGNLLVGRTSTSNANTDNGVELGGVGYIYSIRNATANGNGEPQLILNRNNYDGAIVNIQKDGTTVGSIGAFSSRLYIGNGDTGLFFNGLSDNIIPHNPSTNSFRDAAVNLGDAAARFKDLYLSGGVYLGGTGAANHLDDYEEGTWTPTATVNATSVTVTASNCSYTKVGNVVHLRGQVYINRGTTTGNLKIAGFPFTPSAFTAGLSWWSGTTPASYATGVVINNAGDVYCTGDAGITNLGSGQMPASTSVTFVFDITYPV